MRVSREVLAWVPECLQMFLAGLAVERALAFFGPEACGLLCQGGEGGEFAGFPFLHRNASPMAI